MEEGTDEAEFDANRLSSCVYRYHTVMQTLGDDEIGPSRTTYQSVRKIV